MHRLLFFKRITALSLSAIILGLLSGCSKAPESTETTPPADSPKLIPIRVQADWYAQPEHGGFYQAIAKGFYEAEGLDVTIDPAAPGLPILMKVAQNQCQFGYVRIDRVMQGIAQGVPLMPIAYFMNHSPAGIMAHADNDSFNNFPDLDGQSLVATTGMPYVRYLKKHFNIEFAEIPHNYDIGSFAVKKDAISQCYITSEPYYLAKQGIEVKTILLSKSGFDPYRCIYANKTFLKENPEVAEAFLRATLKGWKDYMLNDPQPAHALIAEANPKMTPEFMANSRKILLEMEVVFDGNAPSSDYGIMKKERVHAMVDILKDLEIISGDLDNETFYDNRFVKNALK